MDNEELCRCLSLFIVEARKTDRSHARPKPFACWFGFCKFMCISAALLSGAYEPLCKKERQTSTPILYFKNAPYMEFILLVLMSFEVTTVTTMDSQEPACCDNSHLLGFLTK